MPTFSARIYKLGINPCVDVPRSVSRTFSRKGFIPVTLRIVAVPLQGRQLPLQRGTPLKGRPDCGSFRANLVPVGSGRHRLFINGEMRKAAAVDEGDFIHLTLEIDREPRITPVPAEFEAALRRKRSAQTAFDGLTPSRRKEILAYLNSLKRPESLKRNIEKTIASLLGNK